MVLQLKNSLCSKILLIISLSFLKYYFIHIIIHLAIVFMSSVKVYLIHCLRYRKFVIKTVVNIVVVLFVIHIKNLEMKGHFLNIYI